MDMSFTSVLAIFLGGALGGVARAWCLGHLAGERGLLVINTLGSFALGALSATMAPQNALWLFCATGVLGAYTTVSGFALQTAELWQLGARRQATAYVVASVVLSVCAAFSGALLGGAL